MDLDPRECYEGWATLLSPVIFIFDSFPILIYAINMSITWRTMSYIAAIELALVIVSYTIQKIKKPDGLMLLLLYKGLRLTFLIHTLMAFILFKTTINPTNMLMIVILIVFGLWAFPLVFMLVF